MKIFFHTSKNNKVQSKNCQNLYLFWNFHTQKCKENVYLEYMNINRQLSATQLMIDIKHPPDTVLVDVDIKHQPETFLIDVRRKMFF